MCAWCSCAHLRITGVLSPNGGREDLLCQGGCVEGTSDTGIDPGRDQRVREAGGIADCEPPVPGDDGTSACHRFVDEVRLSAVVVR